MTNQTIIRALSLSLLIGSLLQQTGAHAQALVQRAKCADLPHAVAYNTTAGDIQFTIQIVKSRCFPKGYNFSVQPFLPNFSVSHSLTLVGTHTQSKTFSIPNGSQPVLRYSAPQDKKVRGTFDYVVIIN